MLDTKEEIEAFFAHAGKKGMKWGVRKAIKTPSIGKAVGLGMYGSKSEFTNPKALQLRQQAGKERLLAAGLSGAYGVLSVVASNSSNPGVRAGASAASSLFGIGAGAVGIKSLVTAIGAINEQQNK